jgi:hypothetical protein
LLGSSHIFPAQPWLQDNILFSINSCICFSTDLEFEERKGWLRPPNPQQYSKDNYVINGKMTGWQLSEPKCFPMIGKLICRCVLNIYTVPKNHIWDMHRKKRRAFLFPWGRSQSKALCRGGRSENVLMSLFSRKGELMGGTRGEAH